MGGLAKSLVNFRGHLLKRLCAQGHEVIACAGDDDRAVASQLKAWSTPPKEASPHLRAV